MSIVLEVKKLSKSFKSKQVITNLSFNVLQNSILGFVGRNGAGKTTTMKMIMDFLKPDKGAIIFCGEDIINSQNKYWNKIGYLPDVPEYYDFYTPLQYMMFCGEISNMNKKECKAKSEELLNLVGLEKDKNRKIKGFSRGMKQRLGVAQALLNNPDLMICDEPTSALDPIGRKEILELLKKAKEQTAVIFSTHILSDVERICDYIGIIEDGEMVRYGTIEELTQMDDSVKFRISCLADEERTRLVADAKETKEFRNIQEESGEVFIKVETKDMARELFKWIGEKAYQINSIQKIEKSLEDIYMEVIG